MYFSKFRYLFFITIISLASTSCTEKVEEFDGCQFDVALDNYELVWQDEFNGSEIDTTKWSYDLGDGCQISENLCGWGNNELQYYTKRDENAFVEDGNLVIRAIKENPEYLGEFDYTSARIVTKNKGDWKYGRIDVSARMPIGKGLWAAIWMLPTDTVYGGWPASGEIDIMEYLGDNSRRTLGTIHYGHDFWRFDTEYYDKAASEPSFHDEFHVFSVLWNEQCIQFMVDGELFGEPNTRSTVLPTTFPFDQKFHLLLNLAVGGNLPGDPDGSAVFPQTMEVDYVRVYQ